MMWDSFPAPSVRRSLASAALLTILAVSSGLAIAQDVVELTMVGEESIDPKERVSGNAAVGIDFVRTGAGRHGNGKLDITRVYAYFHDEPVSPLQTRLTTVDGRYVAEFETSFNGSLKGKWANLQLKLIDDKPLNTKFLRDKYDQDQEIAILVTDSSKPRKSFPVRWGDACGTEQIRIRVNAEGADAYVVSFQDNPKGALARCSEASKKSHFKFDYNCDMHLADMQKLTQLQVIRKRGATYEKPIPIALSGFNQAAAYLERSCAE